jgi:hypothetical protein
MKKEGESRRNLIMLIDIVVGMALVDTTYSVK